MGWLTAICLLIFALMFALRFSAWRANPVQSSWKKRVKLARILLVAALALLAIAMRMSKLGDAIDGKPKTAPTLIEKVLDRY